MPKKVAALLRAYEAINSLLNHLNEQKFDHEWQAWRIELQKAVATAASAAGIPRNEFRPVLDALSDACLVKREKLPQALLQLMKLRIDYCDAAAANMKPPTLPTAPVKSLDELLHEFQCAEMDLREKPESPNSLGIAKAVWRNYPMRMWEIDIAAKKTGPRTDSSDDSGIPVDWTEVSRRKAVDALNALHTLATTVLEKLAERFGRDSRPIGVSAAYCRHIFREGRVPEEIPLSDDARSWPDLLEVTNSRSDQAYRDSLAAWGTIQQLWAEGRGMGVTPKIPPAPAAAAMATPPAPPTKDVPLPPETMAFFKATFPLVKSLAAINTAVYDEVYPPFDAAAEQPAPPRPSDSLTPAVSKSGKLILAALLKHYPTLQSIEEIRDETDLSDRTVGPELKTLITDGLAARPKGKGKGATLTATGKALAERIPQQ